MMDPALLKAITVPVIILSPLLLIAYLVNKKRVLASFQTVPLIKVRSTVIDLLKDKGYRFVEKTIEYMLRREVLLQLISFYRRRSRWSQSSISIERHHACLDTRHYWSVLLRNSSFYSCYNIRDQL